MYNGTLLSLDCSDSEIVMNDEFTLYSDRNTWEPEWVINDEMTIRQRGEMGGLLDEVATLTVPSVVIWQAVIGNGTYDIVKYIISHAYCKWRKYLARSKQKMETLKKRYSQEELDLNPEYNELLPENPAVILRISGKTFNLELGIGTLNDDIDEVCAKAVKKIKLAGEIYKE